MCFGHGFDSRLVHFLRKSSVYADSKETVENAGFFFLFRFLCKKNKYLF
nr:MAG TPA: hypothetical protein [Caudoviricetes sp.]